MPNDDPNAFQQALRFDGEPTDGLSPANVLPSLNEAAKLTSDQVVGIAAGAPFPTAPVNSGRAAAEALGETMKNGVGIASADGEIFEEDEEPRVFTSEGWATARRAFVDSLPWNADRVPDVDRANTTFPNYYEI